MSATLLVAGTAAAQAPVPLLKSDLVRLLTGSTYGKSEIASIVRRSCLAFTPTERDLQSLRALGASDEIIREIRTCVRNDNHPGHAPATPRTIELSIASPTTSAVAGTIASIPVSAARGSTPVRGLRLALNGAQHVPGGARDTIFATTDERGVARFSVPAGTAVGIWTLTIDASPAAPLEGTTVVTLVTGAAAPTTVDLQPSAITIGAGARGSRDVTVRVHDPFGNLVPGRSVGLQPASARGAATPPVVTNDSGLARLAVDVSPLRDGDAFAVTVDGRALDTLRVTSASAIAAANLASGRTALLLIDAARLAATGKLGDAESAYDSIIAVDPNLLAARLGRGYVRSWQHKADAAREDFLAVLQVDTANVGALTGLGYNAAWAGNFEEAESRFRQALRLAPANEDALKGLAYVALWRHDVHEAARRFGQLLLRFPGDAEGFVGLGQARLLAGDRTGARGAFLSALRIDPSRADARQGLAAARSTKRRVLDLSVWGGVTTFSGTGIDTLSTAKKSETGLRFAEVDLWATPQLRVAFQYDNGLSLDNLALVRAGVTAPTMYLGVLYDAGGVLRLDVGHRSLPGDVSQTLVRGEKEFRLNGNYALKLGGWVGPRSDQHTEWLAHGGVSVPVGERVRIEPTVFYSQSGVGGANDFRGLLYAEYASRGGFTLGLGGAAGHTTTPELSTTTSTSGTTQSLWDAYLLSSAPLGATTRANLLLRREQVTGGFATNVIALGLSLGF